MSPSGCMCVLEQSVYWIAYIVGAGSTHSLVLTVAAQAKNLDPSSPSAEGLEAPESLVLVLHKVKDDGGWCQWRRAAAMYSQRERACTFSTLLPPPPI